MSKVAMAKEQDQSMEEILQSIKRIIAEEGEPAPSGSDVLELTELLSEDQADTLLNKPPARDDATSSAAIGSMSIDEIMAAPIESEYEPPVTNAVPLDTPPPKAAPTMAPIAPSVAKDDKLVSDQTLASSMAALSALNHIPQPAAPSSNLAFRSGTTVEDLVIEAIRPMLREWLDGNLTRIVEGMVEKEVRRLTMR